MLLRSLGVVTRALVPSGKEMNLPGFLVLLGWGSVMIGLGQHLLGRRSLAALLMCLSSSPWLSKQFTVLFPPFIVLFLLPHVLFLGFLIAAKRTGMN